jgi:serine/threonine protein phosphatase PrpC
MEQLVKIVQLVNDQIVALNDQQQRLAQQRMGTTLVMAVLPRPQGKFAQKFILSVWAIVGFTGSIAKVVSKLPSMMMLLPVTA